MDRCAVVVMVWMLAGCGGASHESAPAPPPAPEPAQPSPAERAEQKRVQHRQMCDRLSSVVEGSVRDRAFAAASKGMAELRRHRCPAAEVGALEARVAVAIQQALTRQPSDEDRITVGTEWRGCMGAKTEASCTPRLRKLCPKPAQPATWGRRIAAYTRVLRQLVRTTRDRSMWAAAQTCLSHTLGSSYADQLAEDQANRWFNAQNRLALMHCLKHCRLSAATRVRLQELLKALPATAPTGVQPKLQLDKLTARLNVLSARARRLAKLRRLDADAVDAGRNTLLEGDALVGQGKTASSRAKPRLRRRFRRAVRTWNRQRRRLKRKLP